MAPSLQMAILGFSPHSDVIVVAVCPETESKIDIHKDHQLFVNQQADVQMDLQSCLEMSITSNGVQMNRAE